MFVLPHQSYSCCSITLEWNKATKYMHVHAYTRIEDKIVYVIEMEGNGKGAQVYTPTQTCRNSYIHAPLTVYY